MKQSDWNTIQILPLMKKEFLFIFMYTSLPSPSCISCRIKWLNLEFSELRRGLQPSVQRVRLQRILFYSLKCHSNLFSYINTDFLHFAHKVFLMVNTANNQYFPIQHLHLIVCNRNALFSVRYELSICSFYNIVMLPFKAKNAGPYGWFSVKNAWRFDTTSA